jgi:hypothetical protein
MWHSASFRNKLSAAVAARKFAPVFRLRYPRANRVQEHVRLLGILWLAYSAFHLLGESCSTNRTAVPSSRVPINMASPTVRYFCIRCWGAISTLLLLKAVVGVIAGWGLLQRESGGRVLALIVAFVSLINFPIGTVLGVYTLWVLLRLSRRKSISGKSPSGVLVLNQVF